MGEEYNALLALCGAGKVERRLLARLPQEPGELARQQIALLALRERRTLRAMAALEREFMRGGALEEHAAKDVRTCGKAAADSEQTVSEHTVRRRAAFDALGELDARLHKLGEQKLKAIELLSRLDERPDEGRPGVHFSICIPDNGRARLEPEGAPAAALDGAAADWAADGQSASAAGADAV